jgi:cyclic pyranopterin phosphate synthase
MQLVDTYGRSHNNLRISVTDRCNIRCYYCMPETGVRFGRREEILTFEEIERVARVAVCLGVDKFRITGGEPLLRRELPALIRQLRGLEGLRDIALTTNGVLLSEQAAPLYEAGLRRINVHVDTLDRERFRRITRRDELKVVLAGIDEAQRAGLQVKINAVALKGVTEDDIVPLCRFGRERDIEIRFIEFMPLDAQGIWDRSQVLTADEMIAAIEREIGSLEAVPDADPRAPATEYRFRDGTGRVGFIASVSRPFCMNCNRLRLTADGKLRYCLFAIEETDLKPLLRGGGTDGEIAAAFRSNVREKWIGHEINQARFVPPPRPMYSIGG